MAQEGTLKGRCGNAYLLIPMNRGLRGGLDPVSDGPL